MARAARSSGGLFANGLALKLGLLGLVGLGFLLFGLLTAGAGTARAQGADECSTTLQNCRGHCFSTPQPGCLSRCYIAFKSCRSKVPVVSTAAPAPGSAPAQATSTAPAAAPAPPAADQGSSGWASYLPWRRKKAAPPPAAPVAPGTAAAPAGTSAPAQSAASAPPPDTSRCSTSHATCRAVCFSRVQPGCLSRCDIAFRTCVSQLTAGVRTQP